MHISRYAGDVHFLLHAAKIIATPSRVAENMTPHCLE